MGFRRLRRNPPPSSPEEAAKLQKNRRYLFLIVMNSILAYGLYVILTQFPFFKTVMLVYAILLGGFSCGYVFYNRGFSRKNITPEMLSPDWTDEQKHEFIEDGKRRLENSKWCLTIIFPLIVTFFIDMVYLFIYEPYFARFFEGFL